MSDPTIAIKNEKPSDIIEDDSDDETEGADEVVDSDSVEEKTDHQNGNNASSSSNNRRASEQDDDTESLDPRIQVSNVLPKSQRSRKFKTKKLVKSNKKKIFFVKLHFCPVQKLILCLFRNSNKWNLVKKHS